MGRGGGAESQRRTKPKFGSEWRRGGEWVGGRVQRSTKSIHLDLFYLSTSAFGFRLGPKSGTFQPLHFSKKRFRFRTDMTQKRPFRIFSFFDKGFRCSVNCLVPRFRTKSWPIYMTFRAGGSGVTFSSKSGLFDILTS